ncbi:MAG: hypothetical protein WEC75_13925 [Dehalococcoidia bacterium]
MSTTRPMNAIVDMNLLPSEQRPVDVSGRALLLAFFIFAAVAGMFPIAYQAHTARGDADAAVRSLDAAEAQIAALQADLALQRTLRTELGIVNDRLAKLRADRAELDGGSRPLGDDLSFLWGWNFLPPGVRIASVSGTNGGFRIDGTAPDPLAAIAYAKTLMDNGDFPSATLLSFAPGPGGGTYTINVQR